uniref:50S ribosomal protein L13 n=1 Tax=Zeugodacus cucurbitae TaxID=28588 RepID=A0A0A1X447_ZEUCU
MSCCRAHSKKTSFRPNFREKALTEKFYSQHDRLQVDPKYAKKYEIYASNIDNRQHTAFRENRLVPLTENQVYGWLAHLCFDYSTGCDPHLFMHHTHTNEDIKTQLRVITDMLRHRKF